MANRKKYFDLKQSGLWFKSRNPPYDGKSHFCTTTNKMLENGLKYQRRLCSFEKKVLNNNAKEFYFSMHDNRYKDHIYPEHLDKSMGKVKLPEIRRLSILPTYDKAIPLNPDSTKPKTKEKFISEYLATYKDSGPSMSTEKWHRYPKCYTTPNPGYRTSSNKSSEKPKVQTKFLQQPHYNFLDDSKKKPCRVSELKPWSYSYKLKSKNIYNQPKKAF